MCFLAQHKIGTLGKLLVIRTFIGDCMSVLHTKSDSKTLRSFGVVTALIVAVTLSMSPVSAGTTVKRAPSAPVLQSLVAGDKSFTITISAPTDPGTSAVTQYGYALNNGSWLTLGLASIAGTAKVVKVSANDVDYNVKVRAKSSAGWGAVLDAGTVHPVKPAPIYPGAPTIVSAYDTGCHITRVEFVAPTVTFGKITRYRYQLGDGHKWDNRWTIDGVQIIHDARQRPFTLRIQAFNNAKNSGWGEISEIVIDNVFPKCPFYK